MDKKFLILINFIKEHFFTFFTFFIIFLLFYVNTSAGESKAHTYHWIHTLNALGHVQTGTGDLTANYPAAMAFKKMAQ